MTKPIQIGIAGLGRAGYKMHYEELKGREEHFRIVAACDPLADRCAPVQEAYGCRTYPDIADMIADPEVELVDIATRSADHGQHAAMALEAGKYVFLEKPICLSHSEAQQLQAVAGRFPGKLFVRHNRRFDPDFLHVREIIASGVLGDVFEIRLARHGYARRDDWQTLKAHGGGQLLNWGPHIIDHALRFLESPVHSIYGDLKLIAAVGDAEDHVKILLKGENGRLVDLEISGGVAIGSATYRVFGTRGSLELCGGTIKLKYLDPDVPLVEKAANPGTPGATFGTPETLAWIERTLAVNEGDNHVIWDHLYRTIREGQAFPITMEEAMDVMRVISSVKEGGVSKQ